MSIINDKEICTNLIQNDGDIETLRKQFTTRGLSGLVNIGNTCFMNSALQILSATPEFVGYLRGTGKTGEYKNDLICSIIDKKRKKSTTIKMSDIKQQFKNSFAYKLRSLFVIMWGMNCKIKPVSIKEKLGELNSMFSGNHQHDSAECLSFILDQFHDDTKTDVNITTSNIPKSVIEYKNVKDILNERLINNISEQNQIKILLQQLKNEHIKEDTFLEGISYWKKYLKHNHSIVTDIFEGLCLNQIICETCKNITTKFDPFKILSVPLQKENNLHNPTELDLDLCIRENLINSESMSGENQYQCDICNKKTNAIRNTSIWHPPNKLIIHLKRFVNIEIKNGTNTHIITKKISSLIKFPINNFNIESYLSNIKNNVIYDLYGVICHNGGLDKGHYVAYTKNPINNKWYIFDDDDVLHIEENKIYNEIVNNKAYILFYTQKY